MNPAELCMSLMRADTEEEVVTLLAEAGYWDNADVWRYLGDDENNFATIGNQQSEAIAALIEKLINSVDSRLTNACLENKINPEGPEAPRSIRDAVARFFEGKDPRKLGPDAGRIAFWLDAQVTDEGRLLTLAATGNKPETGSPSITVADQGEGQTPDNFPNTFMSLHRANKLKIPFVQGKFNMGGTGVFQFCAGRNRVQLVVARRNPLLLPADASPRDTEWGFTVVRREPPAGGSRSSVFTYLAPIGADDPRRGAVLSFPANSWPIFPEADSVVRDAYHRHAPHGALVKMYEYKWQGTSSNIIQSRDGLLRRIDQGLPELALPVRLYECRAGYRGHSGSFSTNVLGLSARLQRNRAEQLEPEFPRGTVVNVDGKTVRGQVFAFKKDVPATEYRTRSNGVIFAINGQSHASKDTSFFRLKDVGMGYLEDSLLLMVDCTSIEGMVREDLFLNSRDRLRENSTSARLIEELKRFLHDDPTLRNLRNRRRAEDLEERLSDSKPLAHVLEDLIKRSPSLATLFLKGSNLPSPFPPGAALGSGGANAGTGAEFKGKPYPTFFHFKDRRAGEDLVREGFMGRRSRVQFETDAEDEYFTREDFPGEATVWRILGDGSQLPYNDKYRVDNPKSGIATLNLELPDDTSVGDTLTFDIEVTDEMRVDPFVNRLVLRVNPPAQTGGGGGNGGRRANASGEGAVGGGGLALPEITRVKEEDYNNFTFHRFTEESALVIVNAGNGDDENEASVFDFYVNVDNKYLRIVQKESPKVDPRLLEAKFTYALVLVGLALIHDDKLHDRRDDESEGVEDIEDIVVRATSALAPVMLPMIEAIGDLALDEED